MVWDSLSWFAEWVFLVILDICGWDIMNLVAMVPFFDPYGFSQYTKSWLHHQIVLLYQIHPCGLEQGATVCPVHHEYYLPSLCRPKVLLDGHFALLPLPSIVHLRFGVSPNKVLSSLKLVVTIMQCDWHQLVC